MTDEQRKNAEELLDFLENRATNEQCDMQRWVTRKDNLPIPPKEERGKPGCGTAGCLAGWAALLQAPTQQSEAHGRLSYAEDLVTWDSLEVPADWAWEMALISRDAGGVVAIPVAAIGARVLGEEFAPWFSDMDGPGDCHMTDREWMIAVIKRVLGRPYDPRLRDGAEREEEV